MLDCKAGILDEICGVFDPALSSGAVQRINCNFPCHLSAVGYHTGWVHSMWAMYQWTRS